MLEIKVDDMRAAGKTGYVAKIVDGKKVFLNATSQSNYSSSKVTKNYQITEDGIYEVCDANFGSRKRSINFIKVESGKIVEESENLNTAPRNLSAPEPTKAVDIVTTAPKLELPELIESPDCKIAIAANKQGEFLFFTVEFDRDLGYMFGVLVAAVKRVSGRKWNDSRKRWEVPIESGDELKKELIEYYGDGGKSSKATFSLSPRTRELLYSQGIPINISENVK